MQTSQKQDKQTIPESLGDLLNVFQFVEKLRLPSFKKLGFMLHGRSVGREQCKSLIPKPAVQVEEFLSHFFTDS